MRLGARGEAAAAEARDAAGGRVGCIALRDGVRQVCVINLDGTGELRRLTDVEGVVYYAEWRPPGGADFQSANQMAGYNPAPPQ